MRRVGDWRGRVWAIVAAGAVAFGCAAAPVWAQTPGGGAAQAGAGQAAEEPDLSTQATDPTASLMSFNLVNGFTLSHHGLDEHGYEFKFQPVVPFRAWGMSNILRIGTADGSTRHGADSELPGRYLMDITTVVIQLTGGVAAAAGGGGLGIGSSVSSVASGGVGGGVLMAVIGMIRSAMSKA